jgi:hypothetical protein
VAGGTVAATEEEMEAATDSAARLRKGGGGFLTNPASVPILVQMFGKRNSWRQKTFSPLNSP